MKHLKQLFFALFLFASATANALRFEVDGIFYDTTSANARVTYKGASYDEFTNEYSGVVKIPASVTYNGKTYSVIGIDQAAFKDCSSLTSVEIPSSVTSIGSSAFYGCSGLTSIEIPSSVTSIGTSAFKDCSGLTSIEIPNSVTSIGNYAFSGCSGLTSVEIGNSVTRIGNEAFFGCSGLTSIEIPNSVTSIGSNAFYNCSSLANVTIPSSVTSIESSAFSGCSLSAVYITDLTAWCNINFGKINANPLRYAKNLYLNGNLVTDLSIPNSVTEIKDDAFDGYTGLVSITIPNSVTRIGEGAFSGCTGLISVEIPSSVTSIESETFRGCTNLANVTIPSSVTSIESYAFCNCKSLKNVTIPNSVTNIDMYVFYGCDFKSIVIPSSVTSISRDSFDDFCIVVMEHTTPPLLEGIGDKLYGSFAIKPEAMEAFKNDSNWAQYSLQLCSADYVTCAVDIMARENSSALLEVIGDANTQSVVDLTIKGSINSYDIIVIRDKMPNLRYLDLSQATVVASNKAFYNGCCTGNNDLGGYVFNGLTKLISVKLPESLTKIGGSAFYGCSALESVEIPAGVTSIVGHTFYNCSALKSIEIPAGVSVIDSRTFYNCKNLASVTIPSGVTSINDYAFNGCSALKEIKLPPTVQAIASNAFTSCTSLKEVRLPSSLLSVAGSVFASCNAITDVYTYTIEPTSIQESTFTSTVYQNATLHVPSTSYWNYYWDDGWKRFLSLTYFDEPYEYFYLNKDYTLDEESGYIDGTPDVDINAGGGLIVEGETSDDEDVKQELGDVNVNNDGNGSSGSIIGDNNLHIDNLYIKINVKGGRWYFFAFPFDIPFSKISMENGSAYVFRYYDGEERAKKGNGGWKDINENHLKAARGYIFQCSANDVLVLNIENIRFKKEDKYNELVAHVAENLQDASWNFVGNPYLSYYDINDLGYDAPITVWNGSTYEAIRPGDDDYCFTPFEAFFVQKPEGQESVEYSGDAQTTQQKANNAKAANAARRVAVVGERKLVNITLNGDGSKDRTRVVLNPKQSLAYETACDAVKFESTGVAQLYTLDSKNVKYAINERPVDNGLVPVGVKFPSEGTYTITAERMDTTVWLKDAKTGAVHNLADGAYSFLADAGTDEARFSLTFIGGTTGIEGAVAADAVAAVDGGVNIENAAGAIVEIYTVAGALVASYTVSGYVALPAGAYIVKINGNSIKVAVK